MAKKINREIFGVVESNGKSYWTRIGVTFANDDGSENLVFNYFPTDPGATIQLREPKKDEE